MRKIQLALPRAAEDREVSNLRRKKVVSSAPGKSLSTVNFHIGNVIMASISDDSRDHVDQSRDASFVMGRREIRQPFARKASLNSSPTLRVPTCLDKKLEMNNNPGIFKITRQKSF